MMNAYRYHVLVYAHPRGAEVTVVCSQCGRGDMAIAATTLAATNRLRRRGWSVYVREDFAQCKQCKEER